MCTVEPTKAWQWPQGQAAPVLGALRVLLPGRPRAGACPCSPRCPHFLVQCPPLRRTWQHSCPSSDAPLKQGWRGLASWTPTRIGTYSKPTYTKGERHTVAFIIVQLKVRKRASCSAHQMRSITQAGAIGRMCAV